MLDNGIRRMRGGSVMALPVERPRQGVVGSGAARRTDGEVPVTIRGTEVSVAGQVLDSRRIRSVAVVRRPGRALATWGPAVAAGAVLAVVGYLILARLVGAVLPGFAAHAVGIVLFWMLALAGAGWVGLTVWHWSARMNPVTYELRVDADGSVLAIAEGRDFGALKRAEARILTALGDVG